MIDGLAGSPTRTSPNRSNGCGNSENSMSPTMCAAVASGLGVALVSPLYIGAFASVVSQRPFRPIIESEVQVLLPRHRPQSLATRAWIEQAQAYVATLPQGP